MLLRHLYRKEYTHAVLMMPSRCHFPIEAGIEMTKALSHLLMPGMKSPMLVDHYSFNSAQPQTIEELFEPNLPENRRKIRHVIEVGED